MKSKNGKTSHPNTSLVNFTDKTDWRTGEKSVALSNHRRYIIYMEK